MSNVFVKLGLEDLGKVQRWEALFHVYCPALKEEWVVVPPSEGEAGQTEVIDQPDDDTIGDPPPPPGRPARLPPPPTSAKNKGFGRLGC